jgi:hypothetical protein
VLGVAEDISIGRGTRVCFAGRTSGADTCGRVQEAPALYGAKARPGDSGGPVYYDPGGGLTTGDRNRRHGRDVLHAAQPRAEPVRRDLPARAVRPLAADFSHLARSQG